ncbi:hypothetical protein B7P43_G07613 [Cryptotermes secundus]|uniref:Uncharacterized protein n=1 Tax=Cryptotermes secundus TaxID=105785 RepID=A0A2J7PEL3_9NEOP|nr:hypothetical protein B7P43_G07613 [Cryptotermes secundus]
MTVLEYPTHSPDLAPSDLFLVPKIKEILKGRYFDDNEDLRSNTTAALKVIPQNHFQKRRFTISELSCEFPQISLTLLYEIITG